MAAIEYYEDESKWGNYQYTTIEDVINDYSMSRGSDDYTADTPRHQILYQAMKGLREFITFSASNVTTRLCELC